MATTIPILITVSLVGLSLSLSTLQSLWWYSDYPFTQHSLSGGTQTVPLLITVYLEVLKLSLCTSQSSCWYSEYPYTHHSLLGSNPDYTYTHQRLPRGTQTISILTTVFLVVPRLSLYSSQSLWWLRLSLYSPQCPCWYSNYPYTHHSFPGGTQTIPLSSQSPWCYWWYSDYPYTHHSLPGGTKTIPILIKVSLVVLGLSLYSSQSPWR